MRKILLPAAVVLAAASLSAQSPLTTAFASNNGGAVGGAVYFNLTTGASDVCIAAFELNSGTGAGTAGTLNVYTIAGGTYVGNTQAGVAGWGGAPAASGGVVTQGTDNPSFCALGSSITLAAGTTTAVALEAVGFAHRYMNGTGGTAGVPGSSVNGTFGNPLELLFEGGAANNTALTSSTFDPRIANIAIHYAIGSGPCFAAASTPYGNGCYDQSVSYYEEFAAGASDITGTVGVSTESVIHVPNGLGGYWIGPGPGAWFGDDGTGLANSSNASPGIAPISAGLATGDDAISSIDLTVAAPGFGLFVAGDPNPQTDLDMDSNGRVIPGTGASSDFSPSVAELLGGAAQMAPIWGDLSPNIQGTLHFDYDGFSCYCTWADVPHFGVAAGSPGCNAQVALHQGGIWEMRWAGVAADGGFLVGFSTGNGASDPGATDISACQAGGCDLGAYSAPLSLSSSARPITGTSVDLTVNNIGPAASAVAVVVSLTQDAAGTSLAPFGLDGCTGYIGILSSISLGLIIPSGSTELVPFANPLGFEGAELFYQAGALDATAPNTFGATISNGLAHTLGDI